MKNSGKLGYVLGQGIGGVFRNGVVNLAAVGMLIACLVITGGFISLVLNIDSLIDSAGAANEISVFADEDLTAEAVEELGRTLAAMENVEKAIFVSKQEGLESMREQFGDLLDGFEKDNPLRDKFVLTLADQDVASDTAESVKALEGVAKVNFNKDVSQKLSRIRNTLAASGGALTAALCLASVLIVGSSVRVSAYTRRNEIGIMKTVGATDGFISAPFVVEGLFIGLIGAGAAFLLEWLIYSRFLLPRIEGLSLFDAVAFSEFSPYLALGFVAVGCFVGGLGSLLSIKRYLRV
ncbi:MAG: ABC transporter permease [Clostridia bacterium]|nr:ABC transporter permease [Clostridia bacterium]